MANAPTITNPTAQQPTATPVQPVVANDKITGGVVIILATGLIAVLAGVNQEFGKILVIIMVGFLLAWLLGSGSQNDLTRWIGLMGGSGTESVVAM